MAQAPATSAPASRPEVESPPQSERFLHLHERLLIGSRLCFTIEEDAIQMASSIHWGKSIRLHSARKVYFSRSLANEAQRKAILAEAIHEFVSEARVRSPKFVLAIKGAETVFRTFIMPELAARDLQSAIYFEAKKQLPFPIEDCYFDSRVVSKIEIAGQKKIKIALFAALKTHIDSRIAIFQELGMTVSHIIHAQESMGQLLSELPFFEPDAGFSLLGVERTRSEMSYYRGCQLEFSHGLGIGSSFLSNRVDATMYEYFAESMAGEIQNSLDYYAGQYSVSGGNQVMVYGDLVYSDDLIDRLGDRFGFAFRRFPAEEIKSLRKLSDEIKDSVPVCLTAVSAALARSDTSNLLPRPLQLVLRKQRIDRFALVGACLLALLLGALTLIDFNFQAGQERQLAELQDRHAAFQSSPLFGTYAEAISQIATNRKYLEESKPTPSYWHNNLKELSLLTPEGVRLTRLEMTGDRASESNLYLSGDAVSRSTPPELLLAEFVTRLKHSPFYDSVRLARYHKSRVDAGHRLEFELVMRGQW